MKTLNKRPAGRPKKAEEDKVSYQRIAVYTPDYSRLVDKIEEKNKSSRGYKRIKITDAFAEMVNKYCEG